MSKLKTEYTVKMNYVGYEENDNFTQEELNEVSAKWTEEIKQEFLENLNETFDKCETEVKEVFAELKITIVE